ncbi:MAG: HupE/UreJ family protein [Gammaproteobacteria bacterium]
MLEGSDHVLFVLCLVIGAARLGSLVWRVTGFTAGHTLTLIAGFLGWVPGGPWFVPAVETGIALSIIYAAIIALLDRESRSTFVVTPAIGLLHGLGFSFVLHEILRVDSPNLWQSLMSFNVGVEVGQLAIVLIVWPAFWLLRRHSELLVNKARWVVALPCIVFASLWSAERAVQLASAL